MILILGNHEIGAVVQGAVFLGSITPQGVAHTISSGYWDPLFLIDT